MATTRQVIKNPRKKKIKKAKIRELQNAPQRKGYCLKVYVTTPKKPNSAQRKVTKVTLSRDRSLVIAHIPGEDHNLKEYSQVLLQGAHVRDLPGVKFRVIRGVYDASGVSKRTTSRSKYGAKKKND
jgi:small subunit ribosomal protein S12